MIQSFNQYATVMLGIVDKGWQEARLLIQRWLLEAALGERIGLSDEEWAIIGALLPPERGRGCRPAQDNRLHFEA